MLLVVGWCGVGGVGVDGVSCDVYIVVGGDLVGVGDDEVVGCD